MDEEFPLGDYSSSVTLDLVGKFAYVSTGGLIRKINIDGTMFEVESLDVTYSTGQELDRFLVGLFDSTTGLLYMGACESWWR